MHTLAVGSALKAMLGFRQPPYSDSHESIILAELQEACDRLSSRLEDTSLSRTKLISLSADLEPVARQLLQVRQHRGARDGQTRVVHLMDAALWDIGGCLYCTQPWRPHIWTEALRAKLEHAQHSLSHALIALRWERVGASRLD